MVGDFVLRTRSPTLASAGRSHIARTRGLWDLGPRRIRVLAGEGTTDTSRP